MIHSDNLTSEPRLTTPAVASRQEEALERALRPKQLDEYVGQEKIRGQLEIFIQAAKQRSEPLDHVLLFGPPGLGKTTLGADHRARDGCEHPPHFWASVGARGRSRGLADQPRTE